MLQDSELRSKATNARCTRVAMQRQSVCACRAFFSSATRFFLSATLQDCYAKKQCPTFSPKFKAFRLLLVRHQDFVGVQAGDAFEAAVGNRFSQFRYRAEVAIAGALAG